MDVCEVGCALCESVAIVVTVTATAVAAAVTTATAERLSGTNSLMIWLMLRSGLMNLMSCT